MQEKGPRPPLGPNIAENRAVKLSQGFRDILASLIPNKPYGVAELRGYFGVESLAGLTPLLYEAQRQGFIKMLRTGHTTTFIEVPQAKISTEPQKAKDENIAGGTGSKQDNDLLGAKVDKILERHARLPVQNSNKRR